MIGANRTVFIQGRFRFFFYSADLAERMHVHVEDRNGEIKVWMDTFSVVIVRRGMSTEDIRSAVRIAQDRSVEIERAWHEEQKRPATVRQPSPHTTQGSGKRHGNAR